MGSEPVGGTPDDFLMQQTSGITVAFPVESVPVSLAAPSNSNTFFQGIYKVMAGSATLSNTRTDGAHIQYWVYGLNREVRIPPNWGGEWTLTDPIHGYTNFTMSPGGTYPRGAATMSVYFSGVGTVDFTWFVSAVPTDVQNGGAQQIMIGTGHHTSSDPPYYAKTQPVHLPPGEYRLELFCTAAPPAGTTVICDIIGE
jgi:hypothetical protein